MSQPPKNEEVGSSPPNSGQHAMQSSLRVASASAAPSELPDGGSPVTSVNPLSSLLEYEYALTFSLFLPSVESVQYCFLISCSIAMHGVIRPAGLQKRIVLLVHCMCVCVCVFVACTCGRRSWSNVSSANELCVWHAAMMSPVVKLAMHPQCLLEPSHLSNLQSRMQWMQRGASCEAAPLQKHAELILIFCCQDVCQWSSND